MKDKISYPVIDLFAVGWSGPRIASLRHPESSDRYAFKTTLSIEKDLSAHCTLEEMLFLQRIFGRCRPR